MNEKNELATSFLGDPEVATIIMGQSPPSSSYNKLGKGMPFFQGNGDFGLRSPKASQWCSAPTKLAEANDVLISVRAPVGAVNIATQRCCIGRGLAAIRPGKKVISEYLFFKLMSERERIDSYGSGSIFNSITKETLQKLEIKLHCLPEQKAIATVLSKIQNAIELQDRTISTLKELKAATMAKLFREGASMSHVHTQETPFGAVPSSWKIEILSECACIQTGLAKGKKNKGETTTRPYLRVANVQDGFLDLSEIKFITVPVSEVGKYLLQDGDVLLTEGGDFDKLGRGFIWRNQVPECIHQNHIFAVRTNRKKVLPEFLTYLVQSPYGKAYFLKVAHKTTNLACINSKKLKEFPVLLPELSEQREIVSILQKIDERIDTSKAKCDHIRTAFSVLLQQLLSGEIKLSEALLHFEKEGCHG